MLQHLLKTMWKRKGKNLMISAEILLIFVVVFAVVVGIVYNLRLYQTPLGFEYQDRWSIHLDGKVDGFLNPDLVAKTSEQTRHQTRELIDQFHRNLKAMPEVDAVSFVQYYPYSFSAFRSQMRKSESNKKVDILSLKMDSEASEALGIKMLRGRWFSKHDEGSGIKLAVINQSVADALFANEDPIGKTITSANSKSENPELIKVIGVVDQYRYLGEFMGNDNIVLFAQESDALVPLTNLVIKVKPGTPRNFEIKLHQQLKQVRSDIEYKIATLTEGRDEMLRQKAMFFVPPVVIAVFLLLMVSFGLFGVLWQNVNSRIPELGLRRAIGASTAQIYRQIVTEQVLLSSLAMAVGMLFLIQLPFTGIFAKFMDWNSFFVSAGIAMAIIFAVSIICALYPAWVASRMSPTDALHYE